MTVQEIKLNQEIVYQSSHRVIVGKIVGHLEWRRGQYLIPFKGRDGIVYVGDINHIHSVEALRKL